MAGPSIKDRFLEQLKALWAAVSQRSILFPAIFVFLWQARLCPAFRVQPLLHLGHNLAALRASFVQAARACFLSGRLLTPDAEAVPANS